MYQGLSESEVKDRINKGLINSQQKNNYKSISDIIKDNVISLFNLISIGIFIILLFLKSYKNTMFMLVIIINSIVGIVQELRAKRVIDRLRVITEAYCRVIRDGKEKRIPVSEIVQDDVFLIKTGEQISVDAKILISDSLEVDESLITGESEPVLKKAEDEIFSGSFAVSGSATAVAIKVGEASYASKLSIVAKKYKAPKSEILFALKKLSKIVCSFILPLSVALFISMYMRSEIDLKTAIISTSAAIIGMIPEGLILLTNISYAVGTIKLGRKSVVMQEIGAMETLARVNMICFDKTGTITEGSIKLYKTIITDKTVKQNEAEKLLSGFASCFDDKNHTLTAITEAFKAENSLNYTEKINFSSDRKFSALKTADEWLVLGASEFLNVVEKELKNQITKYEKQGYRVLVFGKKIELESSLKVICILLFLDDVKASSKDVMDYFKSEDVDVRIISGDSTDTISNIASKVGINEKALDCSKVNDDELKKLAVDYKVFGRVTPEQKKLIIASIKEAGNCVAMIGDGANDIPALRESDCSIAMASGCDAVKAVSHIVITDSDISHIPLVIPEGRRIINNIERVASLFLIKTTYSILLAFIYAIIGRDYPYLPIHMTLVSSTAVGIPSFFLALIPSNLRIKSGFTKRVLKNALPSGICISLLMLIIELMTEAGIILNCETYTVSLICAEAISLYTLFSIMKPLDKYKIAIFISVCLLFMLTICIFPGMFELCRLSYKAYIILGIMVFASIFALLRIKKRLI